MQHEWTLWIWFCTLLAISFHFISFSMIRRASVCINLVTIFIFIFGYANKKKTRIFLKIAIKNNNLDQSRPSVPRPNGKNFNFIYQVALQHLGIDKNNHNCCSIGIAEVNGKIIINMMSIKNIFFCWFTTENVDNPWSLSLEFGFRLSFTLILVSIKFILTVQLLATD